MSLSLLAVIAAFVLGANPFRGETVAPMDLLQNEPGWQELALDLPPASPHRTDVIDGVLPRWLFLKQALRSGNLPTWNPHAGFGEPAAQLLFNAYLTPRFALFVVFGDALGFYLGLLAQMVVGGLGVYVLARRHVGKASSFFAGTTFMLCGFNVSWIMWPHASTSAMLPWAVWALWRLLDHAEDSTTNTARDSVVLASSVALLVAGGFPAVVAYGGYLCAALLLLWTLTGSQYATRFRRAAIAASAAGMGLALVAVQLAPSLEFLRYFDLGDRSPVGAGIDPLQLLFAPLPGGGPPDPETCGYVGIATLALMLLGVAPLGSTGTPRRRFTSRFWATVVIVSLMLSLRFPATIADLAYRLPGLNLNPNNRALVLFGLAAALLAGFGVQRLQDLATDFLSRPSHARNAAILFATGLTLVQAADLGRVSRAQNAIVPADAFLPPTETTRFLAETTQPGQSVVAEGFLTGGSLSNYGVGEVFSHGFFTKAESQLLDRLVGGAWVTAKAARPSIRNADFDAGIWFDLLSVRYLVGPCAHFRSRLMPESTAQLAADRPRLLRAGETIRQSINIETPKSISGIALLVSRVQRRPDELSLQLTSDGGELLAETTWPVERNGAVGWAEIKFPAALSLEPGAYELSVAVTKGALSVWGLEHVPAFYLLEEMQVPLHLRPQWRPTHDFSGLCVLENRDTPSGAMLLDQGGTPHRTPGTVDPIFVRPESAEYRIDSPGPALLVRSTRSYPGWRVAVNDEAVATQTVSGALQGVEVPSGPSTVSWQYQPVSLKIGIAVSLLAVLLSGWLLRRS